MNVIQTREQELFVMQLRLNRLESPVLAQREHKGHQCIPLFSAFTLPDRVCDTTRIFPGVGRRRPTEHPHERNHLTTALHVEQT